MDIYDVVMYRIYNCHFFVIDTSGISTITQEKRRSLNWWVFRVCFKMGDFKI